MQTNFKIEQALAEWQNWNLPNAKRSPTVLQQFEAGENHHNYLIDLDSQKFVIKIFNHFSEAAVPVQQWASTLRLAPKTHYHDQRYMVMEYFESEFDITTITTGDLIRLANSLTVLHSADYEPVKFVGKFNILKFSNQYLQNAGNQAQMIHQKLEPVLEHFLQDSTPWCLCHNDLNLANCFVDKQQARFIDWEYAQLHNPWFDLAAVVAYFKLSSLQAAIFLKHYRDGWQRKLNSEIFYSSQIALIWCDMLWYLAKYGESYWPQLQTKKECVFNCAKQLGVEL